MIALNNSRSKSNRDDDVQLMKTIEKNNQIRAENERSHNERLYSLKKSFARDNLQTK